VFFIAGALMDEMSMIILLVPIVFPVIKVLGFDPIWFGVIIVVACELGMITPPVGINVFVINSIVKDVRITTIYGGVLPFILSDIIRLALLVIFPMIALWLPMTMTR
jgi:TRAP-type C4-dicarboxylate transport system permease large subunit